MEGRRVSPVCLAILHTQVVLTSSLIALEFAFLVFLASVVRNSEKEVGMAAVLMLVHMPWCFLGGCI